MSFVTVCFLPFVLRGRSLKPLRLSRRSFPRDIPLRRSNSARLMRSRENYSPCSAFISSKTCAILGARPLPFNSLIACSFHWVVGTFQCIGSHRVTVVAFLFWLNLAMNSRHFGVSYTRPKHCNCNCNYCLIRRIIMYF